MSKWRIVEIGRLKIAINELRSIHACNSRDPDIPATRLTGRYFSIYWRGTEKYSRILELGQSG